MGADFSTWDWLKFQPTSYEVTDCLPTTPAPTTTPATTTQYKTMDGVACFTQRGIDIVSSYVGTRKKWMTVEDIVADFSIWDWLKFQPTRGEVTDCLPTTPAPTMTPATTTQYKTMDGVACFTQRGIDIVSSYVGTRKKWMTVEDIVA